MHALCKLPSDGLQHPKGILNPEVLARHRKRWQSAIAVVIDVMSMVSQDQFHQAGVRLRQATNNDRLKCGGLAAVLAGDFLQLPPREAVLRQRPPR